MLATGAVPFIPPVPGADPLPKPVQMLVALRPSARCRHAGASRPAAGLVLVWAILVGAWSAGAAEPGEHAPVPELEQVEKVRLVLLPTAVTNRRG